MDMVGRELAVFSRRVSGMSAEITATANDAGAWRTPYPNGKDQNYSLDDFFGQEFVQGVIRS